MIRETRWLHDYIIENAKQNICSSAFGVVEGYNGFTHTY